MSAVIWVFIVTHYAGLSIIPAETLTECKKNRAAVIAEHHFGPERIGPCYQMQRQHWINWNDSRESKRF
jgi:hypothetical protein